MICNFGFLYMCRLTRAVGKSKAMEIILTGRNFKGTKKLKTSVIKMGSQSKTAKSKPKRGKNC